MKGITLIELIVGICIIVVLILTCIPAVSNHSHKIDHGEVVEYTFTVPETEYYMYNIGDNYPKE